MADNGMLRKLGRLHSRLNGTTVEYTITKYRPMARRIVSTAENLRTLGDTQLKKIWAELGRNHTAMDQGDLTVRAYALVHEAIRRVLRLEAFTVQIVGGLILHEGRVAQMQTGEGKTLTAVFAACRNALEGGGVHVLTFNDYLARRDARWMGPVYRFLGVRVGFVTEGMTLAQRRSAYNADVTYLTAKEAGFDYLRDGLCYDPGDRVQRGFNYAIIDEADSILIDEARVPLIIAGDAAEFGDDDDVENLYKLAGIAPELQQDRDFALDAYGRTIYLTERGIRHVESAMDRGDLYAHGNEGLVAQVSHALHAEYLLSRDRDYIVRGDKVELVDEFTGRVAERRRWPEGLQAAIQAKEGLPIQSAGMILNSIPLQHFLQLYTKRSGMTATAAAAHEELREFYGLHVVTVPPNRPCIRQDHPDVVLATRSDKLEAVVGEIERVHARRRPILAGTASVRESEHLASVLRARGIHCAMLNAKNDEQEAAIVAEAGRLGAVTISTNMAGRGTDIRLGGGDEEEHEAVTALGGLYVIGTNRYESRRIDNQLRGRAGRQGDAGSSRFFVSLEDKLFVKYRLNELIPKRCRTVSAGTDLKHPVIGKEIDRVQRIAEGQNLEVKKMLRRYTLLLEQQRTIMRQRREEILLAERIPAGVAGRAAGSLRRLTHVLPRAGVVSLCKRLVLHHTDRLWSHYLSAMAETREGIHLRTYGKQDPLFEYQKLAIELFEALPLDIERAVCRALEELAARGDAPDTEAARGKGPSATWTYTISDNPFEDTIRQLLGAGGAGLNAWAGLLWPLTALLGMVMRCRRKREAYDTIRNASNQRSSD